jgi:hypothetical protein
MGCTNKQAREPAEKAFAELEQTTSAAVESAQRRIAIRDQAEEKVIRKRAR